MAAADPIHNRALDALDALAGEWQVEISDAQFIDGDARLPGRMSATWLDGRAFLVLRSASEGGPPASVQVIGRNEDSDDYTVLYTDGRGVSRVYAMTLAAGEWTLTRTDPGFHQRFHGHLTVDANRIDGDWSRSHDNGETWVYDFHVTYTRT